MKTLLFFSLFLFSLFQLEAMFPDDVKGQILYLMKKNESEKALKFYLDYSKQNEAQDFELLQQACGLLLENAIASKEKEIQLMGIFGAGVALNHELIPLLQKGLKSEEPKIQLTALHFLGRLNDDEADYLIMQALSSPLLLIRLEAAYELAKKKQESVITHLQSLFNKVPEPIRPLFPEIISLLDTPTATRFLEKLLNDPHHETRLATIIEAGKKNREDLIPRLRFIATHTDATLQEAALGALGAMQDRDSKILFEQGSQKKNDVLRLISLHALTALGEEKAMREIENLAEQKNLFAITLLGKLEKNERRLALLKNLALDPDFTTKFNANLSLLMHGEMPSKEFLRKVFVKNENDYGFLQQFSPGKALHYWVLQPAVSNMETRFPNLKLKSHLFAEKVLEKSLELDEEAFLSIAEFIFKEGSLALIPSLVELLVNHGTENALLLLKSMQQKAGAPFIRNSCNLALYRLDAPGPYEENLLKWVENEKNHALIRFQDEEKETLKASNLLTPEETSQLLLSSFETLASKRNQRGIDALIHAIAYGNPQNKYALAGLLIRTTE